MDWLSRLLPEWEEPDWASRPFVSVAGLQEASRGLDPRALTHGELVAVVEEHFVLAGVNNASRRFDKQVRHICETLFSKGRHGLYLVCPYARRPVDRLYLVDGQLVSREALSKPNVRDAFHDRRRAFYVRWHLSGENRWRAAEERAALDAEARRLEEAEQADPFSFEEAEAAIARRRARVQLEAGREARRELRVKRKRSEEVQRRARLQGDELGVWAALRRAEKAGRAAWDERLARLHPLSSELKILDAMSLKALDGRKAPLRDHLHVDVRVLCKERRYWRPGRLTTVPLLEGVTLGVDLRSMSEPQILFAFEPEGGRWLQRTPLSLAPINNRVRPMLICSVDGPVEVLALRSGRFASIKAQRLAHPSVSRPLKGALRDKARKQGGGLKTVR